MDSLRTRKTRNHSRRRTALRGQSLVEFALTLPILLLITLGIFDFGRALFTYSEVSNRTRNALRYGSIKGFETLANHQYTDCQGVIDRARRVTFATPDISVMVSYIDKDYTRPGGGAADGIVTHDDAIVVSGVALQCKYQNGTYTYPAGSYQQLIQNNTSSGDLVMVTVDAKVRMITPVFPQYMPIVIQGMRTLTKSINLASCGDGHVSTGETCWNCPADAGLPPEGASPPTCWGWPSGSTFTRTTTNPGELTLNWSALEDENNTPTDDSDDIPSDSYQIERRIWTPDINGVGSWGTTWTLVHPPLSEPTGTSLALTGLSCSTYYQFRIRGEHGTDPNEVYSTWKYLNTSTLACAGTTGNVPNAGTTNMPAYFSGYTVGKTKVILIFQDRTTNEDQFDLITTNATTSVSTTSALASSTGTGFVKYEVTVTCGVPYYFQVRAFKSPNKDTDYARWPAFPNTITLPCTAPPIAATGLSATYTTSPSVQVTVNWTDNEIDESGYRIERLDPNLGGWYEMGVSGPSTPVNNPGGGPMTWPHTTAGVTHCGVTYTYRVKTLRGTEVATSWPTAGLTNAPACTFIPADITLALVSKTTTSVNLSWTNVAGEAGYDLERSADGGTTWTTIATPGADSVTYADTGLTCDITYIYRVRARDGGGNYSPEKPTNILSVKTVPCGPVFDMVNTICRKSGSIFYPQLTWTIANTGADGYEVYARMDGDAGAFKKIHAEELLSPLSCWYGSGEDCFQDAASIPYLYVQNTGYDFYVRAKWPDGTSSDSSTVHINACN
jgi:hypothetical protein